MRGDVLGLGFSIQIKVPQEAPSNPFLTVVQFDLDPVRVIYKLLDGIRFGFRTTRTCEREEGKPPPFGMANLTNIASNRAAPHATRWLDW